MPLKALTNLLLISVQQESPVAKKKLSAINWKQSIMQFVNDAASGNVWMFTAQSEEKRNINKFISHSKNHLTPLERRNNMRRVAGEKYECGGCKQTTLRIYAIPKRN